MKLQEQVYYGKSASATGESCHNIPGDNYVEEAYLALLREPGQACYSPRTPPRGQVQPRAVLGARAK